MVQPGYGSVRGSSNSHTEVRGQVWAKQRAFGCVGQKGGELKRKERRIGAGWGEWTEVQGSLDREETGRAR